MRSKKQIINSLRSCERKLSIERDKLVDLMDEIQELKYPVDEGLEDLECCIEKISELL
jgi:hypothetical protein